MKSESDRSLELGEIIETITPPKKLQTSEFLETGDYPIIDQSPPHVAGWTNDETSLVYPPKEGLLVFGDHTCVLKFQTKPFAQGADGIKIIKVQKEINSHYVYAHLKAYPLLNDGYKRHFSELKRLKILIPDLKVQDYISGIRQVIDAKIDANNELSKTLENIAQTIFKSWFIDFDPVKAKMAGEKPVGMDAATVALFPDSMEKSEIGLIPKGWVVYPASELFEVGIGRTPPRKEAQWFCKGTEGIPWVSIRDMGTYGTYSHGTNEGLTQAAVEKFKVPIVPENTVLMSFKLTVGKLCISDSDLVTNEAIAHFKISEDSPLDTFYTYLWLSNLDMGSLDSTSSIGTATNSGVIKQIKFLLPPRDLLGNFHENVSSIFSQLKLLRQQTTNLVLLRDSLLPRLISGELQIPEEMLAS